MSFISSGWILQLFFSPAWPHRTVSYRILEYRIQGRILPYPWLDRVGYGVIRLDTVGDDTVRARWNARIGRITVRRFLKDFHVKSSEIWVFG